MLSLSPQAHGGSLHLVRYSPVGSCLGCDFGVCFLFDCQSSSASASLFISVFIPFYTGMGGSPLV